MNAGERQAFRHLTVQGAECCHRIDRLGEPEIEHFAKPFDTDAIVSAVEAVVQEPAEEFLAMRAHPEDLARLIDKLQTLDG